MYTKSSRFFSICSGGLFYFDQCSKRQCKARLGWPPLIDINAPCDLTTTVRKSIYRAANRKEDRSGSCQGSGLSSPGPRLSWRPLSFLTALVVGAISYCGPILRTVRQRTFVCQRLAKVAVLNPRAGLLAPIAVVRH
jgi:hypothetical protein